MVGALNGDFSKASYDFHKVYSSKRQQSHKFCTGHIKKKKPVWHPRSCSFALGNKYDTNFSYYISVKILSTSDLICHITSFTII